MLPANERVNQHVYFELLNGHLPESFEVAVAHVFQHGAPAHTAKFLTTWLSDCEVGFIRDWPGNSPDINPIENL